MFVSFGSIHKPRISNARAFICITARLCTPGLVESKKLTKSSYAFCLKWVPHPMHSPNAMILAKSTIFIPSTCLLWLMHSSFSHCVVFKSLPEPRDCEHNERSRDIFIRQKSPSFFNHNSVPFFLIQSEYVWLHENRPQWFHKSAHKVHGPQWAES